MSATEEVQQEFDEAAELAALGLTADELDDAIALLESDMTDDIEILDDLKTLWKVPEGLNDKIMRKAWRQAQTQKSLSAFGGLFGLGWETTKIVTDPVDEE